MPSHNLFKYQPHSGRLYKEPVTHLAHGFHEWLEERVLECCRHTELADDHVGSAVIIQVVQLQTSEEEREDGGQEDFLDRPWRRDGRDDGGSIEGEHDTERGVGGWVRGTPGKDSLLVSLKYGRICTG